MQLQDLEGKKFRKRLLGLDPGDVDSFLQDMNEVLRGLVEENENLKRVVQTQESELKEHREREKTIRAVLISAQKNAEQTRANAEREAKLVVSEAEVKAEGLLNEAGNRLIRMEQEISEMRRNRIQFGARMRALLDAFRQMLDDDGKEAPRKFEEKPEPPVQTDQI
jgi:cell division initiation protein